MNKLILSQTGVFRLQQLAHQMRSCTGIRHKLSDQKSILHLLHECQNCADTAVRKQLHAFSDILDNTQSHVLQQNGVMLTH